MSVPKDGVGVKAGVSVGTQSSFASGSVLSRIVSASSCGCSHVHFPCNSFDVISMNGICTFVWAALITTYKSATVEPSKYSFPSNHA